MAPMWGSSMNERLVGPVDDKQAVLEGMQEYEALDYRRSINRMYRQARAWEHKSRNTLSGSKWFVFFCIGVIVGLMAFFLGQTIGAITQFRFEEVRDAIDIADDENTWDKLRAAWLNYVGFAALLAAIGSTLVALFSHQAAGSGVPEVIAYLNGIKIRKIFGVSVLLCKFGSVACAVSSGLPVGYQGPLIHLGAALAHGLSEGRSRHLRCDTGWFKKFRTTEDRLDFITGGAAAGVAAAFAAPLGGLLFALEEVASWWYKRLTWMVFFACVVASFTAVLWRSQFRDWDFLGVEAGYFDFRDTMLFFNPITIKLNLFLIFPAMFMGCVGGVMGAAFTAATVRVRKFRIAYINRYTITRLMEPVLIVLLFLTAGFWLAMALPCSPFVEDLGEIKSDLTIVQTPWCKEGEFSSGGSLFLVANYKALTNLFSRAVANEFEYSALFAFLALYFVFFCWTSGTGIACGDFVPMLTIGATSGRIVGRVTLYLAINAMNMDLDETTWMNPGVFALIGAASMVGGVSRLTTSLTAIMLEISGDLDYLMPVMAAVMMAKFVAERLSRPLYTQLLQDIKTLPFFPDDFPTMKISRRKLDCFCVADVMTRGPVVLEERTTVREVIHILNTTTHGAFPVVIPVYLRNTEKASEARAALLNEQKTVTTVEGGSRAVGATLNLDDEEPDPIQRARSAAPKDLFADDPNSPRSSKNKSKTKREKTNKDKEKKDHHQEDDPLVEKPVFVFKGTILRKELATLLTQHHLFSTAAAAHLVTPLSAQDMAEIEDQIYLGRVRAGPGPDGNWGCGTEDMDLFINLEPLVNTSALALNEMFSLKLAFSTFRSLALRHLTVTNYTGEVVGIISRKDLMGSVITERLKQRFGPRPLRRIRKVQMHAVEMAEPESLQASPVASPRASTANSWGEMEMSNPSSPSNGGGGGFLRAHSNFLLADSDLLTTDYATNLFSKQDKKRGEGPRMYSVYRYPASLRPPPIAPRRRRAGNAGAAAFAAASSSKQQQQQDEEQKDPELGLTVSPVGVRRGVLQATTADDAPL